MDGSSMTDNWPAVEYEALAKLPFLGSLHAYESKICRRVGNCPVLLALSLWMIHIPKTRELRNNNNPSSKHDSRDRILIRKWRRNPPYSISLSHEPRHIFQCKVNPVYIFLTWFEPSWNISRNQRRILRMKITSLKASGWDLANRNFAFPVWYPPHKHLLPVLFECRSILSSHTEVSIFRSLKYPWIPRLNW